MGASEPRQALLENVACLEVDETNDIAQELNQTLQLQPFQALVGCQLHWNLRPQLAAIREASPSRRPLWRSLASGRSDDTGDV